MPKAVIFNIQRFSTEDGPGIRTTVFFKGCPLSCLWCHNPEGIRPRPELMWYKSRCIGARDCLTTCPENALTLTSDGMVINRERCTTCGQCEEACPAAALEVIGKEYSVEELFFEVNKDEAFYRNSDGGVTLGGGDPGMFPEFSSPFLARCKEAGISTAIDTTGAFAHKAYDSILPHTDLILYDLKQMDEEMHKKATGVGLSHILKNAEIFGKGDIPIWVRTPIIPGWTDQEENVRAVSRFIAEKMPAVKRYELLAFNNLCSDKYERLDSTFDLCSTPLVEKEKMEKLASIARDNWNGDIRWSGATRLEGE
jgi:pyruvate formate lyase activating enzyme